jgi:ADP-heptose:LPS heptosyltransferase
MTQEHGSPGSPDVATLQRIDALFGPPLCFLLSAWNRLVPGRRPPVHPSRAVFVKLSEQGATVLASAAIREAVRRYGREGVHFVAFAGNRAILDLLDLLPPANILEIRTATPWAFLRSVLATVRHLRRLKVDVAYDLDFFARGSAVLAWMTGAPIRVGLHAWFGEGPYRGSLVTHRCRYNPHVHTARFFLSLVHAADHPPEGFPSWTAPGTDEVPRADRIRLSDDVRRTARALVRDAFGPGSGDAPFPRLVLLNANCSDLVPLRRWMPERYAELARRLLAHDPGLHVLFTGSRAEAAATSALADAVDSPRCRSVAGRTTLPELLALYDLAAVLVTNDSGPVHFASVTSVRTVALYGPETPALFGPHSDRAVALFAGLPCSPCVSAQNNRRSACRDNRCMRAISVDDVFRAVVRFLEDPPDSPPP